MLDDYTESKKLFLCLRNWGFDSNDSYYFYISLIISDDDMFSLLNVDRSSVPTMTELKQNRFYNSSFIPKRMKPLMKVVNSLTEDKTIPSNVPIFLNAPILIGGQTKWDREYCQCGNVSQFYIVGVIIEKNKCNY